MIAMSAPPDPRRVRACGTPAPTPIAACVGAAAVDCDPTADVAPAADAPAVDAPTGVTFDGASDAGGAPA